MWISKEKYKELKEKNKELVEDCSDKDNTIHKLNQVIDSYERNINYKQSLMNKQKRDIRRLEKILKIIVKNIKFGLNGYQSYNEDIKPINFANEVEIKCQGTIKLENKN